MCRIRICESVRPRAVYITVRCYYFLIGDFLCDYSYVDSVFCLLATTGLQCFEGMKAYKSLNGDGSIRLFRPDKNMKRLQDSMDRLHMPGNDFDGTELTECIKELVRTDAQWIPEGEGYSLYIRPTVIATHKYLGVAPPDSILLYVICCPVGPYYKSGFEPVRLTADTSYVRAWPGGTGGNKVGGNYGATSKLYDVYVQHRCTPNSTVSNVLFGYAYCWI